MNEGKNLENISIDVEKVKKEPTESEMIAFGSMLTAYFKNENDVKIFIDMLSNHGGIYIHTEHDLKGKDFLDKLHILDINYLVGYYALNFTLKHLES
jgi:hypothetical protein